MSNRTDLKGLFHSLPFPSAAANKTTESEEEYEKRFKETMADELVELKAKVAFAKARLEKFRVQPDAVKMQHIGEVVGQLMGTAMGGENKEFREVWGEFYEQDAEQEKENMATEVDESRKRILFGDKEYGPVYLQEEQYYKPITRREMGNPDNRPSIPGSSVVYQKKYHTPVEVMSIFTKPLGDHYLTDEEIVDLKSGKRAPLNVVFVTEKNPCFAHYYNMHVDMCGEIQKPTVDQAMRCASHSYKFGTCLSKHHNWIRARTLEVEEVLGKSLKPRGKLLGDVDNPTYEEWQEQSRYKKYVTQEEDGQVVEIRYEDPVDLELSPEDLLPYRTLIMNKVQAKVAQAEANVAEDKF